MTHSGNCYKSIVLYFFLFALCTCCVCSVSVAKPLYIGIFTGGDSRNPATGGWDNDAVYSVDREMVNWQGRNFAFEQTYMSADFNTQNFRVVVLQELELIWYYGRVPMVNLSFDSVTFCKKTLVQLAQELQDSNSVSYRQLVEWAEGLKEWLSLGGNNRFLLLAFLQEGNYSICFDENDPSTKDFVDPSAYKQAFVEGRNIIESVLGEELSKRVQWVFAPNNVSNITMPGFEEYYPGDEYVDWVGISSFNFGGYTSPKTGYTAPWGMFDSITKPYLDRLRKMAPRKPLALLQFGSISFGGDKNEWIVDFMMNAIEYPKLYIVFYFNIVKPGELGFAPGFDWPVFWNDPYDARSEGYNVYLSRMRYDGWLQVINDSNMIFSPIDMPSPEAFANANWDIRGVIAPISNQYNLFPELRDRNGDIDGDGVSNWDELAAGLNPLIPDVQSRETSCDDGIDNDANGRTDSDDTVSCGDIPLSDGIPMEDKVFKGEFRFFSITVPYGAKNLEITLTDMTADVDLYVKKDFRPSLTMYDYKSTNTGNTDENINISFPESGIWHIMVKVNGSGTYKILTRLLYLSFPDIKNALTGVACDYDGNGQDDIVLLVSSSKVQAFTNNHNWIDFPENLTGLQFISCGDLNADGTKDIVVANSNNVYVFDTTNWAWRTFGSLNHGIRDLLVSDVDRSGINEVVVLSGDGNTISILNSSGASYTLNTPVTLDIIMAADIDNNGFDELIGLSKTNNVILYYSFVYDEWYDILLPPNITKAPDILKVGDVDSDDRPDLVGVWNSGPFSMQVRSGFTEGWTEIRKGSMAEAMPVEILLGDVDGDNKDDIICRWDKWGQTQIWLQRWEGWRFVLESDPPLFMVVGNFDGDTGQRADVAIIWPDRLAIFYNEYQLSNINLSTFVDVPPNYWAYQYVETIYKAGITQGCWPDDPNTPENEAKYCPEDSVTRRQMAVFILKTMNVEPDVCTGDVFCDVGINDWGCRWIEKFSELGITSGCWPDDPNTPDNEAKYCPSDRVTRAQMAVFILKAMGIEPNNCTGEVFSDVDAVRFPMMCGWIEKFAELGITSGCYPDNPNTPENEAKYCPDNSITRAQMAVFLVKAFFETY